jgi:hypothetical protein
MCMTVDPFIEARPPFGSRALVLEVGDTSAQQWRSPKDKREVPLMMIKSGFTEKGSSPIKGSEVFLYMGF